MQSPLAFKRQEIPPLEDAPRPTHKYNIGANHKNINLIVTSQDFSGSAWIRGNNQECAEAENLNAPLKNHKVIRHLFSRKRESMFEPIMSYYFPDELRPGHQYTATALVLIPKNCRGMNLYLVFEGIPSITSVGASMAKRDRWQRVWVAARLLEHPSAKVSLIATGEVGDEIFSTAWTVTEGVFPEFYDRKALGATATKSHQEGKRWMEDEPVANEPERVLHEVPPAQRKTRAEWSATGNYMAHEMAWSRGYQVGLCGLSNKTDKYGDPYCQTMYDIGWNDGKKHRNERNFSILNTTKLDNDLIHFEKILFDPNSNLGDP